MKEPQPKQEDELAFLRSLGNEQAQAEYLYQNYYRSARGHVLKNSGSQDDAKDLFQDVVVVLIGKIRRPDFSLREGVPFSAYVFGVVQKLWLIELKKRQNLPLADEEPDEQAGKDTTSADILLQQENRRLFLSRIMNTLGADCRALLTGFYYDQTPLIEMAKIMGYTEGYVRVKKVRCMEQLATIAKNDPDFNQLK